MASPTDVPCRLVGAGVSCPPKQPKHIAMCSSPIGFAEREIRERGTEHAPDAQAGNLLPLTWLLRFRSDAPVKFLFAQCPYPAADVRILKEDLAQPCPEFPTAANTFSISSATADNDRVTQPR